jgi:TusE/DsrC/DsvC family sulfur relay protein
MIFPQSDTGKFPEIDIHGYLLNPEDWNEEIAVLLCKSISQPPLTESHWKVIRFLRYYYFKNKECPGVRLICDSTGFTLKEIYALFPKGPVKGAVKIAGLPRPVHCY